MPLDEPRYAHVRHLPGRTVADARTLVADRLKEEGFGILTEIDVEATLRQKLGTTFRPFLILGACNPQLAERALTADPNVGLLLPCNVCIWQESDGATVAIARPEVMFEIADNPAVEPVMHEARARLERVVAALT